MRKIMTAAAKAATLALAFCTAECALAPIEHPEVTLTAMILAAMFGLATKAAYKACNKLEVCE